MFRTTDSQESAAAVDPPVPVKRNRDVRKTYLGLAALLVVISACAIATAWFSGGGQNSNVRHNRPAAAEAERAAALSARLKKLHRRLGKPQPGEWLAEHEESGQTFAAYVRSRPVRLTGKRRLIYVQPIGPFSDSQRRIVTQTAEFLGLYYGTAVKVNDDLPLSVIPQAARRRNPGSGQEQILSTYVLDDVLEPRLPDDAAAMLALSAVDLWPGRGWNFVFGQASLAGRVGVWSMARFGDPAASDEARRRCLLRTLKTATHETGHMFSLRHCIAFECNLGGSNSLAESDRQPLALCPVCLAKVCWATGADAKKRYAALAEFCRRNELRADADFFRRSLTVLKGAR